VQFADREFRGHVSLMELAALGDFSMDTVEEEMHVVSRFLSKCFGIAEAFTELLVIQKGRFGPGGAKPTEEVLKIEEFERSMKRVIQTHPETTDEIPEIRNVDYFMVFFALDSDGSGELSPDELTALVGLDSVRQLEASSGVLTESVDALRQECVRRYPDLRTAFDAILENGIYEEQFWRDEEEK
jgi:hypothetical protein